ncbi:MAG: ABC transporter permease [Gemmataceae bacterium]|nr:ABC transporter permease [Gemmataceae bacterium]
MRWYIVRTLLKKEALRHFADRGGIFLALLLVAAALLLSVFGNTKGETGAGVGVDVVRLFYVDYFEQGEPSSGSMKAWVEHLRGNRPADFRVTVRAGDRIPTDATGRLQYEQSTAAVQLRVNGQDAQGRPRYQIMFWHPGEDSAQLAPFVRWFWKETQRHFQNTPLEIEATTDQLSFGNDRALIEVRPAEPDGDGRSRFVYWPTNGDGSGMSAYLEWLAKQSARPIPPPIQLQVTQEQLEGRVDWRSTIATGLVVFAVYFFCAYLLPAMTCEERERGVLLAQALSPASTGEILLAKFLFYASMGIGLSATLAGIYKPNVLLRPFFWLSILAIGFGYLGVGLTIASLAQTQRRASMGALCYMLIVALFMFICNANNIPFLPTVALEYHVPRLLHSVMMDNIQWYHWGNLVMAGLLALGWTTLAAVLFRRRGWQ